MSRGTPIRPVRVPSDLWEAVKTRAAERGETVTDVILRALRGYADAAEHVGEMEDPYPHDEHVGLEPWWTDR